MARPKPPATGRAVAVLLTGLVAFGPMSTDLYLPSLPAMTRALGTDVAMVQLTLSVFLVGFAVAQLVYGPLADRFGRRPVLLGGILTYVAASLVCLVAPSIEALIAGRFLQAVGACAGPVVGRAVVRDVYAREQAARVLSYMGSAMALAPAVAPIIGGWVQEFFGWRANFVLLALFGVVLLAASWRMLGETSPHLDREALRPGRVAGIYAHLLRQRIFLGYTLAAAFSFAGLFSFISGSSFVLIDVLAVSPRQFGFAFAAVVAGYATGTFLSGRLTVRIGLDRMIGLGAALGVAAAALLAGLAAAGIERVWAVVAPMSLYFLSVGLVLPNAMAGALAPFARAAGTASALLGFIQMAAGAAAGFAVGRLHDGTTLPMAAVILAMAVTCLVVYMAMVGRK